MSLKAQVEALIYAAEEPITLEQLCVLLKDSVLAERAAARENAAMARAIDDTLCESTLMPELDASWDELNGLEPGPLMPIEPELTPEEELPGNESVWEDDEPLFAMEAAALSEFSPEDATDTANAAPSVTSSGSAPESASVAAPEDAARKRKPKKSEQEIADDQAVRARLREVLAELVADYASEERGMEIRPVAGGFRMATKPQHHDLVRAYAKGLKPPMRLSLAALETLAVIAYKQPITAPEIAEIRGVESAGVLGTLLDRKLITTAGRKQVIGRPMQYRTSRDFLLRFGLNDVNELPSMEEFSQLALDSAIADAGLEVAPAPTPIPTPSEAPQTSAAGAAEAATGEAQSASASGNVPEAGNSTGQ